MKNSILPLALFVSSVPLVHAATNITFESPYDTAAALSTGATAPTNTTTNRAFDGQQGWSRSTSGNGGNIITTTTSGNYTGGQALTGSTAAGTSSSLDTYIGGKAVVGPMTSLVFDFRYYGVELGVGGWNDAEAVPDGLFDQTEAQFMAGIVSSSGFKFGVRGANFGTRYSTGTVGTPGNWYRMTITPDSVAKTVTLGVFDLTANTAVALGTSVFTLTTLTTDFGVATTAYEGISARVTSYAAAPAAIDNIQVIPEPAAALLGGLGMLSLLRRRRN